MRGYFGPGIGVMSPKVFGEAVFGGECWSWYFGLGIYSVSPGAIKSSFSASFSSLSLGVVFHCTLRLSAFSIFTTIC